MAPPGFTPGSWRIESPGGATIGAFRMELTLPPKIRWRNRDELATIDLSRDLEVKWDGSGYTAADVATVTVTSTIAWVECRTGDSSGSVTIPASLLTQLRPPIGFPLVHALGIEIGPRMDAQHRHSLPLVSGGEAVAIFDYRFSDGFEVTLR
jgi:hypothetical protein